MVYQALLDNFKAMPLQAEVEVGSQYEENVTKINHYIQGFIRCQNEAIFYGGDSQGVKWR